MALGQNDSRARYIQATGLRRQHILQNQNMFRIFYFFIQITVCLCCLQLSFLEPIIYNTMYVRFQIVQPTTTAVRVVTRRQAEYWLCIIIIIWYWLNNARASTTRYNDFTSRDGSKVRVCCSFSGRVRARSSVLPYIIIIIIIIIVIVIIIIVITIIGTLSMSSEARPTEWKLSAQRRLESKKIHNLIWNANSERAHIIPVVRGGERPDGSRTRPLCGRRAHTNNNNMLGLFVVSCVDAPREFTTLQ